jgi:SpoVK/Ycf46/Vps4 family AAA+-type ATPase
LQVAFSPARAPHENRLALLAGLHAASKARRALVVVDDADAFLSTEDAPFSGEALFEKGYLNHLLDETCGRVVWVVHRTEGIDASVRRRFAFSVQLGPLSPRQRRAHWDQVLRHHHVRRLVTEQDLSALTRDYPLSPAAVEAAIEQAAPAESTCRSEFVASLRQVLDAKATLLDGESRRGVRSDLDLVTEALSMKPGLDELLRLARAWSDRAEGARAPSTRLPLSLLFFGPAGTGKSLVAEHLAQSLGRPAMLKSAGDLLSAWVGATEQNIIEMFDAAKAQRAVLILDEVDSLVFQRSQAQRSFEVTRVNEFLQRLERFDGILIGTTNRIESLDEAARRRFRVKVAFATLSGEHSLALYRRVLAPLAKGRLSQAQASALAVARHFVPADFFLVRDNCILGGETPCPHTILIDKLMAERDARRGVERLTRPLGFRIEQPNTPTNRAGWENAR